MKIIKDTKMQLEARKQNRMEVHHVSQKRRKGLNFSSNLDSRSLDPENASNEVIFHTNGYAYTDDQLIDQFHSNRKKQNHLENKQYYHGRQSIPVSFKQPYKQSIKKHEITSHFRSTQVANTSHPNKYTSSISSLSDRLHHPSQSRQIKEPTFLHGSLQQAQPVRAQIREIEKNNISLSFNLDFSKYVNTNSVKKVKGRSSLNEREQMTQDKINEKILVAKNGANLMTNRLSTGAQSRSIQQSDRSVSKESSKYSIEVHKTVPAYAASSSSIRIRDLLTKIKNTTISASTKMSLAKEAERQTKHRASEGTVNNILSKKPPVNPSLSSRQPTAQKSLNKLSYRPLAATSKQDTYTK